MVGQVIQVAVATSVGAAKVAKVLSGANGLNLHLERLGVDRRGARLSSGVEEELV